MGMKTRRAPESVAMNRSWLVQRLKKPIGSMGGNIAG